MGTDVQALCKNCKFKGEVVEELVLISARIAQIKDDKTIVNKVKDETIANENLLHDKIFAIEGIGDGSKFIKCVNVAHLNDVSGQEEYIGALHKYYSTCPHFEVVEGI